MGSHVGDGLAVQPDLAAVPQALDVPGAGHGAKGDFKFLVPFGSPLAPAYVRPLYT